MLFLKNKKYIQLLQKCYYSNNSKSKIKEYVYTKYRIALPYIDNVKYDDIYLSNPNRNDLYVYTKKVPIFLRFLKLITSLEKRNDDFINFARRCENGLSVERDVYLTKEELLEIMFINGYTKKEINAFDLAFNNNYEFHYPEIAVLFQLNEEDVYKFCLKKRSEKPENLIHLKFTKNKNMLSSYGLIFVFLYFGLNNFVLCNAWFLSKTVPFFSVFYMLASYFYKDIYNFLNKEKKLMIEENIKNKLEGEEIIYNQLKHYAKDADCSSYLLHFKKYSNVLINKYRQGYINEQKKNIQELLEKKLNEIYNAEENYKKELNDIIMKEITNDIYHQINTNEKFEEAVFNDCINNIKEIRNKEDTIIKHVKNGLNDLKNLNKNNPLVKNVLKQYEIKEKEYLNKYSIQKEELIKIKNIINKCNFDVSKLNKIEYDELIKLFYEINNRFGFYIININTDNIIIKDKESQNLEQNINKYINDTNKILHNKQLVSFLKAFQ